MWLGRSDLLWFLVGVVAAVVAFFDLWLGPMWPFRLVAGVVLVLSTLRCPLVVVVVFVLSLVSGDVLTGGVLTSILSIVWGLWWLRRIDTSA